jgi:hypothetical protein
MSGVQASPCQGTDHVACAFVLNSLKDANATLRFSFSAMRLVPLVPTAWRILRRAFTNVHRQAQLDRLLSLFLIRP